MRENLAWERIILVVSIPLHVYIRKLTMIRVLILILMKLIVKFMILILSLNKIRIIAMMTVFLVIDKNIVCEVKNNSRKNCASISLLHDIF